MTRTPLRPQPGKRSIERQVREIALAGADVAGRVEAGGGVHRVANQDSVLQVVDQVVANVELGQAVAEQGMFDRSRETPRSAAAPGRRCRR